LETDAPGILATFAQDLREAIGEPRYRMWISRHTKFTLNNSELLVGVPNRFYRDWLDTHYRAYMEGCVARTIGSNIALVFRIDPELFRDQQGTETNAGSSTSADSPPAAGRPRGDHPENLARLNLSRFALSRFVVGPSNRVAHSAATTLIEDPRRGHSPLFIYGPNGMGKTHLLRAVEDECLRRHRHLRTVAITSEEFTNAYIDALKGQRLSSFRQRLRSADILLVDDISFLCGKTRTLEEFLHTMNALENRGAKIVITSSIHPRKLDRMPEELRSRMIAGMAARIESPDRDLRRQMVVDKAVSRGMDLSGEVVDFLADQLRSSISEIEGAINYLEHFADTFGRRLTLEGVRTALGDILRHSVPVLRVDELRDRFCKLFEIQPRTLGAKKRIRSVSHPRMLVLYLARKYTSATYSEIGREIAELNHSSVIAAEKKILRDLHKDGEIVLGDRTWKVRDAVEAFERELGPR
jgi:chromosomal replication initiator protein